MLQERIHAAVPGGAAGLGVFQRGLDTGEQSFFLHFKQFLVARFGEHDLLRTIVLDDVDGALGQRFVHGGDTATSHLVYCPLFKLSPSSSADSNTGSGEAVPSHLMAVVTSITSPDRLKCFNLSAQAASRAHQ